MLLWYIVNVEDQHPIMHKGKAIYFETEAEAIMFADKCAIDLVEDNYIKRMMFFYTDYIHCIDVLKEEGII